MAQAQTLTGLANPNLGSAAQHELLAQGVEVETLSKKSVAELVKEADGDVEALLNLRMQLAKTSIKSMKLSSAPFVQIAGCAGCSSSTGPIEPGVGPEKSCNCKTCPRTICQI